MAHYWSKSTVFPICKKKGSVMDCELSRCKTFRAWYESGGKVVEKKS